MEIIFVEIREVFVAIFRVLHLKQLTTWQADSNMNAASILSQDECHDVVKNYFQTGDFEVKSFTLSPLSVVLNALKGDYLKLRVSVSLRHRDTEGATTLEPQFFVKSMPLNDEYLRCSAMSTLGYQKEVLFFGDLLADVRKHLRSFEEEACRWLDTVPRCYYLRPDLLVLEDMTLLGFCTLDPLEPLSLRQCQGVVRALARFHGASLVYEEREGKRLADAHPLLLQETLFRKEQGFPLYEENLSCIRTAHVLLDLLPKYSNVRMNEKLHSLLDYAMEEIYDLLKPSKKYRNVLCHRDLCANNMLFTYGAGGEASVRLLDVQALHLEPPAHDVMIFLHCCTSRVLRKYNGRFLQILYHNILKDVLRQHDLDIETILPLQVFLQSCQDAKKVAVILAAYTLQVTMLPLPRASNVESLMMERMSAVSAAYRSDNRFRHRMTETMEELVEACLLPRLAAASCSDHAPENGSSGIATEQRN